MKILLYEPGVVGHRPVILRYTQKILSERGVEWIHEASDYRGDALGLVHKAKASKCDFIYIMTLEGLAWFVWRISWMASFFGIIVIGTYYLFNNLLEGWKSIVWCFLLRTGRVKTIFISDDSLADGGRFYPKQVKYLPDPWDEFDFEECDVKEARNKLGISVDALVFLMFGSIDERKGADMLMSYLLRVEDRRDGMKIVFLLAGQSSDKIRIMHKNLVARLPKGIQCLMHDFYIPECDISRYFYASDYIINAYPSWFKVSSGAVTRALAAGRPIIVPNHGVNADLVVKKSVGLLFVAEDFFSFKCVIDSAIDIFEHRHSAYLKMSENSKDMGRKRTLSVYARFLMSGVIQ